ncbi:hypothetical protein [Symbiopectobacterium purcellii]
MNLQHDRIAALCEQLKLDRLPAEWPAVAQTTRQQRHSCRLP